jgi:hypothetical protein
MREISRARRETPPSYQLAEALLECAMALRLLDRNKDAVAFLGGAREIADANGYHELRFRLDNLEQAGAAEPARRSKVASPSAQLARDVAALEPERLPAHVRFAVPA